MSNLDKDTRDLITKFIDDGLSNVERLTKLNEDEWIPVSASTVENIRRYHGNPKWRGKQVSLTRDWIDNINSVVSAARDLGIKPYSAYVNASGKVIVTSESGDKVEVRWS